MSNFASEYKCFIDNLENGLDKKFKISFHHYTDDSIAYSIESNSGIIFNYIVDKENNFKNANLLKKDTINGNVLNEFETTEILSNINGLMRKIALILNFKRN